MTIGRKALAMPALLILLASCVLTAGKGPARQANAEAETNRPDAVCIAASPWPAIPISAPANSTYMAAGEAIPERFRTPPKGWVRMRFASAADVNRRCAGGVPICGRVFLACVRDGELIVPTPCDEAGAEAGAGSYAGTLCHELAHIQGWPPSHGD